MWLEVYRWYDTRLLGSCHVLLERRQKPRFTKLESVRTWKAPFSGGLELPPSPEPLFWTAACKLNWQGTLRQLLFRIPESTLYLAGPGHSERFRILPPVLAGPVMGTYLPSDLGQMARTFSAERPADISVTKINFDGPGNGFYQAPCEFELLRPVEADKSGGSP
jgi:hypothetical protein